MINANTLENPGLAIIIDPWESLEEIDGADVYYKSLWKNIVNSINADNNIQTVILASYGYDFCQLYSSEWMIDSYKLFYDGNNQVNTTWRDSILKESSLFEWPTNNGILQPGIKVPETILEQINKKKLMCLDTESLVWYVTQIVPHIKNIWYFGCHWGHCIRERAVGYSKLSASLTGHNHLSKADCVAKIDNTFANAADFIGWTNIKDTSIYVKENGKNA